MIKNGVPGRSHISAQLFLIFPTVIRSFFKKGEMDGCTVWWQNDSAEDNPAAVSNVSSSRDNIYNRKAE